MLLWRCPITVIIVIIIPALYWRIHIIYNIALAKLRISIRESTSYVVKAVHIIGDIAPTIDIHLFAIYGFALIWKGYHVNNNMVFINLDMMVRHGSRL